MQKQNRRNLIINTTQIVVWVGVFLVPALVTGTMTRSLDQAWKVFVAGARLLLPVFILYSLNYYLLVPKLLHGGKAKWFYLINAAIILAGYWLTSCGSGRQISRRRCWTASPRKPASR